MAGALVPRIRANLSGVDKQGSEVAHPAEIGGTRRLRLNDSTFCEVRDLDALDVLLSSLGHRDGRIDRMQRHLQLVMVCCAAFVVLAAVATDARMRHLRQLGAAAPAARLAPQPRPSR